MKTTLIILAVWAAITFAVLAVVLGHVDLLDGV